MQGVQVRSGNSSVFVSTPKTFFYDEQRHIQVIEDLQPAIDLAGILTLKSNAQLPIPDYDTLGSTLGSWLRAFHDWAQAPAQLDLQERIAQNKSSQELKWRTTYDTIVSIAESFPTISKEDMDVLAAVRNRAFHEYQQQMQMTTSEDREAHREGLKLIHGDFWTGK